MDRIIEVKVGGNHLSKDNKVAGVRGEANVTNLRITFDEVWEGYAKKVTFWNALGENPVERTLTADLLENIVESTRVYIVPIPGEAMTEAGMLTFVIDGYVDGKRQRSIADKLLVKDAPIADNAGEPADPTPSQAEQIQGQIDTLLGDMQAERKISETCAELSEQYKEEARVHAESAADSNEKAQKAAGKASYIGNNGNWFAWDSDVGAFYDTKVRAQAGSYVYRGENPPAEADVWIIPDGSPLGYYNIAETNALIEELRKTVLEIANKVAQSPVVVTLYLDRWVQDGEYVWYQEVEVPNTTKYSKVDLMLTEEQFEEFHLTDTILHTVNDGGKVTVYCRGELPSGDLTMKATVSEVIVNGE